MTYYPAKYIYNWIHGENIHLIHNCDKRINYDRHVNEFIDFLTRNYSLQKINNQLSITSYNEKKRWMSKKEKKESKNNYVMIKNDENCTIISGITNNIITINDGG
jgi:hypothetical protein